MWHTCVPNKPPPGNQLVHSIFLKSNRSLLRISDNSNNIMPKYISEYASDTELLRQRTVGSSYTPACYFVLIPANCTEQQYSSGLRVVTFVK